MSIVGLVIRVCKAAWMIAITFTLVGCITPGLGAPDYVPPDQPIEELATVRVASIAGPSAREDDVYISLFETIEDPSLVGALTRPDIVNVPRKHRYELHLLPGHYLFKVVYKEAEPFWDYEYYSRNLSFDVRAGHTYEIRHNLAKWWVPDYPTWDTDELLFVHAVNIDTGEEFR